ncbi:hypothetical protein ACZ91_55680 [Streptomyces regensis]|nr:hypothetical protein ACZ91_55680 [Streptomyces regensis]KOG60101.1 hypothetical protein ADK77_36895 [Streptomyces antibioticus]
MIRVPAWVTDTVHGSPRKRARRVSMRCSCSHSHASSDASVSSAGEIVRRVTATQRSAWGAERASNEATSAGCHCSVRSSVQHSHQ